MFFESQPRSYIYQSVNHHQHLLKLCHSKKKDAFLLSGFFRNRIDSHLRSYQDLTNHSSDIGLFFKRL